MSALKYKLRDGWQILYGGILSRVLRKDRNLADLTNKTTARQNLELDGDNNTTHFHDSRYNPLIQGAEDRSKAYTDQKISDLTSTHNADKTDLSTRINSLTTTTNGQITTINNNITSLNGSLKQYVDTKVAAVNTTLTNTKNQLTTEINNIKNRITPLETNVNTHTTQIANINSKIEGMPKIYVQSGAPSNPPANAVWFKTGSEPYISVYDGSKWVAMGAVWK